MWWLCYWNQAEAPEPTVPFSHKGGTMHLRENFLSKEALAQKQEKRWFSVLSEKAVEYFIQFKATIHSAFPFWVINPVGHM